MTGRTHDLAAFTALNLAIVFLILPKMSFATAVVAFGACFIGGLTPDFDKPTSNFWDKFPAGSFFGRILQPFLGAHRHFSHSIFGLTVIGYLVKLFLNLINQILIVDVSIVWWAFIIGYVSHLIMDLLTKEGIALFFPIPFSVGLPPVKFLRIKTGGIIEKALIFPGLIAANIWLVYQNYGKYLEVLKSLKQ